MTIKNFLADPGLPGGFEIEIGCGNGHFLAAYAAGKSDTRLLGIDIKKKRCQKAREKAEKRGLGNVSIIHARAESLLRELPEASVDAFHIYFPDPWPKSRHRKRRFFTMERLRQMHGLLRPGGRIYFGTDFFDYYMQAKVLVVLHGGFRLGEEPASSEILSSLYGLKFAEARKRVHLFSAFRRTSADEEGEDEKHEGEVHRDVQRDEQG